MTEKFELYKCNVCGNIVQILFSGVGELVCCGENMQKLEANQGENNALSEKHLPEIEENEFGKFVRLNQHPMTTDHYIQFIQVISKDKKCLYTKFLYPNELAEANISFMDKEFEATELCNIHGLWRNANDK